MHLVRMIVAQKLVLTAAGLGLGMTAAVARVRGLCSLLYLETVLLANVPRVGPVDAARALALAGHTFLCLAAAASVRVRRPARIDPLATVRSESERSFSRVLL